jgi:glycosyltransferase involved in cell wall biosynthesis
MEPGSVTDVTPRDLTVIVPARHEAERIAETVRAALTLGPVLVVDDGSRDGTGEAAREAGASVVRLRRNRGKGAALAAGLAASPPSAYVLFLDADLGASAVGAARLVTAVRAGECDLAIAAPPPQPGGGHGFVVRLAREGIKRLCGFEAAVPLSGQRCLTREAAEAASPFAWRFGVEVGMTVDLVRAGYRVAEVPADLRHRVTGTDWRAQRHRARQYRDVAVALLARRLPRAGSVRSPEPRHPTR